MGLTSNLTTCAIFFSIGNITFNVIIHVWL